MHDTKVPPAWQSAKETPARGITPEQRQAMIDEALDFLEYTEEKLLELESSPQNTELVLRILRSLERVHTLARALDLQPALELLQKLQNLLYHVHQGKRLLNREDVSWLYESVELLQELFTRSPESAPRNLSQSMPGTLRDWYDKILDWTRDQMHDVSSYNPFRARSFTPRLGELLSAKGLPDSLLTQVILPPPTPETALPQEQMDNGTEIHLKSPPPAEYKKRSVYFGHVVHEAHTINDDDLNDILALSGDLAATLQGLQEHLKTLPELARQLRPWTTHLQELQQELHPRLRGISSLSVDELFQRLQRMMQEFRRRFQKEVELELHNHSCYISRSHKQVVADILIPLVRNAVEHGIEDPTQRIRNGKKAEGTVKVVAHHRDGLLEFCITDDGRGMNRLWLQTEAIRQGQLSFNEQLDEQSISSLLFEKQLAVHARNQLHGYGLAQVSRRVRDLHGTITYRESPEGGCEFIVRLPLPPSFQKGLMGRVRRDWFFVPTDAVKAVIPLELVQFEYDSNKGSTILYGDEESCLVVTDELPQEERPRLQPIERQQKEEPSSIERFFVVLKSRGGQCCAIEMNGLQPDVMLEQTFEGSSYRSSPFLKGGGMLEDGQVVWMLDTTAFLESLFS